ncbi:MAG: hypothetical protein HUJ42_02715 [Malacoplasma sp.]|nr:hypothetical protein [Malacoplasma sp.]
MFKKNKKFQSWSKFLSISTLAIVSLPIGFGVHSNSQNLDSIVKQATALQASVSAIDTSTAKDGYNLVHLIKSDGKDSGIAIKIPDFSNPDAAAQKTANSILNIYQSVPSNLISYVPSAPSTQGTTSATTLSNLIQFDSTIWQTKDLTNAPRIFNLGSVSTYNNYYQNAATGNNATGDNTAQTSNLPTNFSSYNLDSTKNLPALVYHDNSGGTPIVASEDYLNQNGILALQISVSANSTGATQLGWQSFYVLLSGFGGSLTGNASSNNVMLPASYYKNGVNGVSDANLVSFLLSSFSTRSNASTSNNSADNASVPNIKIVERNNDNVNGVLSYTSNFLFNIPSNLAFSESFNGITDSQLNSLQDATGSNTGLVAVSPQGANANVYYENTSYNLNFVSSGFQPTPPVSNTDVLIIVIVIIAVVVIACVSLYFITKLSRKIRFQKAL